MLESFYQFIIYMYNIDKVVLHKTLLASLFLFDSKGMIVCNEVIADLNFYILCTSWWWIPMKEKNKDHQQLC